MRDWARGLLVALSVAGAVAEAVAQGTAAVLAAPGMSLPEAIREALQFSPDLRPQEAATALADIAVGRARAEFALGVTPTLSSRSDPAGSGYQQVGVGLTKRTAWGASLGFQIDSLAYRVGDRAVRDNGYTLSFSQPLLRGFGLSAQAPLVAATRAAETARRQHLEAEQRLVVTVAEAFFGVVRQERLLEAMGRSRDRALRLRDASTRRAAVGLATQLDVLRAELLAAQADATLSQQAESLEASRDRLKTLLGRPVSGPLEINPTGAFTLLGPDAEVPLDIGRLVDDALTHRLDVAEARDRVTDARRASKVARWDLLPPVSLDAAYTQRGLGSAPVFTEWANGWRVGLSTNYRIDRATERAALAATTVTERTVAREARDVEERAATEVRLVHRAWVRSRETRVIHERAVALAEKQLRLAELRYERGLAGNFDVVDAESSLFQAQSSLIDAEIEQVLSALRLRRAAGTLDPQDYR